MDLKEIDIGNTVDTLEYFLEIVCSDLHIISFKYNDLDLSHLKKFRLKLEHEKIIIEKENINEEYSINNYLDNENIEIIKKTNNKSEMFIFDYEFWYLCIYFFKHFENFLSLNTLKQRRIINETYL